MQCVKFIINTIHVFYEIKSKNKMKRLETGTIAAFVSTSLSRLSLNCLLWSLGPREEEKRDPGNEVVFMSISNILR